MGEKSGYAMRTRASHVIGKIIKLSVQDNVYCGAFFQSEQDLIDWTNSQKLLHPIYCIGDGHAGIWNLFQEIGVAQQRQEILDWYHLKENLYKAGGSLRRLKQAESLLWCGQVNEVIALFKHLKKHLKHFAIIWRLIAAE